MSKNNLKTQSPCFPYLKLNASKRNGSTTTEHHNSRNTTMSWKHETRTKQGYGVRL